MLRYHSFDIVFQEVPDEVSLAINISNCPNRCKGCHSPHLMEDRGVVLDLQALSSLLSRYGTAITCICFMGGDNDPKEVERLAAWVHQQGIKTAWYSGKQHFPSLCSPTNFDYIKLGPYIEHLGGLGSPLSNQRFYRVENRKLIDITALFTSGGKAKILLD